VNPGDEVLIPDPHFVSYNIRHHQICGGTKSYDTYRISKFKAAEIEAVTPALRK